MHLNYYYHENYIVANPPQFYPVELPYDRVRRDRKLSSPADLMD